MSQFSKYLEIVQENRNDIGFNQDLEVYEESKIGMGIAAMLLSALSYGGMSGVKNYVDKKTYDANKGRMTELVKHSTGYGMSKQQATNLENILKKIYEEKKLNDANLAAIKDLVNYEELAPSQQENFNTMIGVLRNTNLLFQSIGT